MIGFLALALHWFNPLVWIAYIILCKDIEIACDERVVQFMELDERKSYSAALLSCSGKQMHLSANPVAFGEVSVKQRILSVLNYKKPSFWISTLGVVAFFFVAVCLMTSPMETIPAPAEPAALVTTEETLPIETTAAETEVPSTFAATLDQEDIVQVCTDAINALCEQESYLISRESVSIYPERENDVYSSSGTSRRYGNDLLILNYEQMNNGETSCMGSSLYFGDMYGFHYGDYWVHEGTRDPAYDIHSGLKEFSPEGKTVTFPEATGIISDDSVSFHMEFTRYMANQIKALLIAGLYQFKYSL